MGRHTVFFRCARRIAVASAWVWAITTVATLTTAATPVLSAAARSAEATAPPVIRMKFVGNSAFLATDGHVTLAIDFPYRSGANGSPRYDFDTVRPTGIVVCLITHAHFDHFDPTRYMSTSWSLIAPPGLAYSLRTSGHEIFTIHEGKPVTFEGIRVDGFVTPHGDIEHYSYLVTWHGATLYVTGDAENAVALHRVGHVDVALVNIWLAQKMLDDGERVDAGRVVICHRRAGMKRPKYPEAIFPEPGQIIEIPGRR